MTLRKYIPPVGKIVTLNLFSDYTERNIHVWARLEVLAVTGEDATIEVLNGSQKTGQIVSVPLSAIAPPIGWRPRYTIHCKPEQVNTVLSWFSRGIVVRQSHDMSGSMPKAFQPMDNSASPHWQYVEVTDAIPAEDCARLFRIVKVESQDIYDVYLVPDPTCIHCKGTGIVRGGFRKLGRSKRAKLIKEWEADGWKIEYIPNVGGYWIRTRETVIHDWAE